MTIAVPPSPVNDADLVALSLQGDREAYAAIVARYQSVICALAYASCGDVHQSEDLAQETFIAAWKDLGGLKDPSRLRAWLRGIARNIVNNALRKQGRIPPMHPQPGSDVLASDAPTPADHAITQEERALLWQNLARLPEEYREPMVLYYRQQESVAAVAEALEISQDAARQRLSRGRAMLANRIEQLIGRGLRESGPGKFFTMAVVSALPGASAAHAVSVIATAQGGASVKAAGVFGAVFNTVLGPVICLASGYLSYRIGLDQTIAPQERRFIRRFFLGVIGFMLVFAGVLLGGIYGGQWMGLGAGARTGLLVGLVVIYVACLLAASAWYSRRIQALRAEAIAQGPHMLLTAQRSARQWRMQYRSKWKLLGLPLVDVQIGSDAELGMPIAKGWIAIGPKAYGLLFACGAIAVAPVSWGAFSIGVISYGGLAVGVWAIGALALGWKAVGVCAIAWSAAQGVVALAHDYASAVTAFARHANDAKAQRWFAHDPLFVAWKWITERGNWLWLVALVPLIPVYRRALQLRREEASHPRSP